MAPYEQYHVFSIPQTLLDTLVPRNIASQSTALNEQSRPTSPAPPTTTAAYTSGARACNICMGTVFVDVDEQRIHFRSDWHRYNVKMRMGGGNVVTEAQFSQLVDGEYHLFGFPAVLTNLRTCRSGGLPLRFSVRVGRLR